MMKPQRKAVRAGALDRALASRDAKLEHLFVAYHDRFVVPLERRLKYLETPAWKRVWLRLWRAP